MSGGTVKVPRVLRARVAATGRGARHAQSIERYFTGVPGIKVVAVSNPRMPMGSSSRRCATITPKIDHFLTKVARSRIR
jgi:hypothetical protein